MEQEGISMTEGVWMIEDGFLWVLEKTGTYVNAIEFVRYVDLPGQTPSLKPPSMHMKLTQFARGMFEELEKERTDMGAVEDFIDEMTHCYFIPNRDKTYFREGESVWYKDTIWGHMYRLIGKPRGDYYTAVVYKFYGKNRDVFQKAEVNKFMVSLERLNLEDRYKLVSSAEGFAFLDEYRAKLRRKETWISKG